VSRRLVGVYVDPRVDREIEHLAVDTGKKKSDLYELGAKILIDLVTMKTLGTETANKLGELQEAFSKAVTARADARQ